jgi:prepilin-type N-terminal cleavage/methylation domain-containing protein
MPAARPQPLAAHRRGYTLVELILVIAVLGLAGALVAARRGDRGDFDTQALVRKLVADATFAQMDALANQEFRRIEFLQDPDTGEFLGWCIVRLDETELGLPYDPSTARHVRDSLSGSGEQRFLVAEDGRFAGARVSSPAFDGGRPFLTFDELGGTVTPNLQPGTGGQVAIEGRTSGYVVRVAPVTGKITIVRE